MKILAKIWIPFLLLFIVCPAMSDTPGIEEAKKSMKDMFWILNTADIYLIVYNRGYPPVKNMTEFVKEVESVTQQLPNRVVPTKDAWGNEFQYRCHCENKEIWIISYGSDGKPDSGIYDSSGIPNKEEYPPTFDAKSDIIFKNGKFIRRNPAAEDLAYDELKSEYSQRISKE